MARAYEKDGVWIILVRVVSQEQYDSGPFDFGSGSDGSLVEVVNSFAHLVEMIPPEHRAQARCEIDSASGYEDSHYARITVEYTRPATDQEIAEAVAHREAMAANDRNRDIAAFQALKAKLGV